MHPVSYASFFDELEKIAAQPKKQGSTGSQKAVALGAGTMLPGMVAAPAGALLTHNMFEGEKGHSTTPAQVEQLKNRIHPQGAVHTVETGGPSRAFHVGKGFDKGTAAGLKHGLDLSPEVVAKAQKHGISHIPLDAGPHVAAHELGHGAFRETRVGGAIGKFRGNPKLVNMAHAGGFLGSMGMASQDPDSTTSKLAPLVGGLSHAPVLADEAYASLKGIREMRRAGMPVLKGSGQLLKAFGTYGLQAAPAVAAPYITRKVLQHYKKKRLAAQATQPQVG